MPLPDRSKIDCKNCQHWGFDMDMDPFCTHEHANSFGTNINAMRGTKRTPNMRGEPCGPLAQFFVQGTHRWAFNEPNASVPITREEGIDPLYEGG